jgi:hypothetical protein
LEHESWGSYGIEAVTRQQPPMTKADWEDLVRAVINCVVWINDSAIVTCT